MRRREVLIGASAMAIAAQHALAAPAPSPPRSLFAGGADDFVATGFFNEFGPGKFLFDYGHNRVGQIAVDATGRMTQLNTLAGPGSAIASLTLTPAGDKLRIGERDYARIPVRREAFTATSGTVQLSAEIAVRRDKAPIGTVLLIYGSGAAPKEAFDLWALYFLARGWAVVTYDKRGSGKSTGDWRLANLETLASDAAAVIAEARRRNHIKQPIGVWGASQAGWVMPQLATKGLVDFIIMHAGAATTPGEQILDQVEAELTAYGFPPDEIARAKAYYALDTDVSRGRAPWSAIDKAYAEAKAAKAEWLIAPPAPAAAPERTFIRLVADFDPAPYWRQSRAPLLAIFGGKDVIVPPSRNAALLKTMIRPDAHIEEVILPHSNHLCMIADTGVRAEYPKCSEIDPGYFPAIAKFLSGRPRG
jgi:uncharacterized protein